MVFGSKNQQLKINALIGYLFYAICDRNILKILVVVQHVERVIFQIEALKFECPMGAEFICRIRWVTGVLRVSRAFFDSCLRPISYLQGLKWCSQGGSLNCALLGLLPRLLRPTLIINRL